mmetsp:Transcript_21928/g.27130  ORF Transcript_21928/g.27130 Transcript_21928/m.27130 type:complete len:259 (-) Transcript_21928:126-902(-)|eukprot:CAMPEP_0172506344 /NCGR_PEP_ID=MMETSP1066-20121228/194263_1 /TAXON_ID=671091 /ORGANISM="Coscinodiscus wailesii, Strain CCMP2513" /LENGTH=258 /DNA_ID=CAMNT_0013283341 /DNA_START=208 /DNA_END=984 /DNA_ORIENTATION=+
MQLPEFKTGKSKKLRRITKSLSAKRLSAINKHVRRKLTQSKENTVEVLSNLEKEIAESRKDGDVLLSVDKNDTMVETCQESFDSEMQESILGERDMNKETKSHDDKDDAIKESPKEFCDAESVEGTIIPSISTSNSSLNNVMKQNVKGLFESETMKKAMCSISEHSYIPVSDIMRDEECAHKMCSADGVLVRRSKDGYGTEKFKDKIDTCALEGEEFSIEEIQDGRTITLMINGRKAFKDERKTKEQDFRTCLFCGMF